MSKKLYAFEWLDWHGVVQGLFIEEESIVNDAIGKEVYFGEILGKHSEVVGILEECDLEVLVSDEEEVEILEKYDFIPFGYNPLDYLREEDEGEEEEMKELYPCPCCGGEVEKRWFADHEALQCDNCRMIFVLPSNQCGKNYIEAYNTRTLEIVQCWDCEEYDEIRCGYDGDLTSGDWFCRYGRVKNASTD